MVPFLLPQSDLSFGLRCGQGQGANRTRHGSLVHLEFPSTCVLPPSLPCPPFPPISKSHISPARSLTLFTSLNNYPLVFFRGLALLWRCRIPIYSFRDPPFFPFSRGGTYSLRVLLAP